ncbi:hypothetical protein Vadar_014179 [Vaccinium darrowii]|uniref:Uncharacterized protein n=1 Tax=Vaccinium darrowii TaxID=229202 RepID=A0ACB7Y0F8_9ERIC|nr:hypothetical protein Vadar_014179 [Vaccinium darrowii]
MTDAKEVRTPLPTSGSLTLSDGSPRSNATEYDAPNFNSSLCNKKLIGAKFFTTGFKNLHHPTVKQLSSSYHSPRDGDGHGTHTASTAAGSSVKHANLFGFADGTARGVATNARIATYKACVKNQCANSDMLAAMESAIQDGVHVLSLSLGAAEYPYHQNFIARGGFAAMQSGIFVTCAAGNSGPDSYSVTNTAPWLTTVGAGSIDRAFRVDVLLGDGETYVGSSLYHSSAIDTYASPLLYIGQCDTFYRTSYDLMGKIVVCTVNFPSFEFVQVVKEAGGVGTILINSVNLGETLLAISFPLPAATVDVNEGAMILTYISNTKNPTASFKFEKDEASLGKERAPILASFSSRGPNPLVPEILKPDVIAPGLNILAAFIPDVAPSESPNDPRRAKFNILSGTSMACPHVAGAAALLLGAHPSWSPAAIRSAMMTTADTIDNRGLPILNHDNTQPATALGIGAGHINPERARDPGLVYDADVSDYIAFLCGLSYTADQMKVFLAIPNPCSRSSILPANLNYPSFSVVFRRDNKLQELTRTVTCVGKLLPEVYRVNIVNPASEKVTITVEPETLTFSNVSEKQSYKIKFEAIFTGEDSSSGIEELVFGSMPWVSKTHVVRSPIVVMWITNPVESGGSEAEPPQVFKNAGAILWHKLSWFLVNVLWFLVTSVVFSLV